MFRIGRVRVNHLQSGQALIIAVLAMTALIGMVAMTIDVGRLFHDRRNYQNTADAMALAGVAELPTNPGLAITKARTWGINNNVSSSQVRRLRSGRPATLTTPSTLSSRASSAGPSAASWV